MKIEFPTTSVQTSSPNLKVIPMAIGDTKLVADLLRKHYQNPLRTMIQEYLSNARDIHRQVKQEKKIKVSLPTKVSPNLVIRDFGTGLSEEMLVNYFCSYASSSKREDNTQTGGFGIGCKSAWAYRENFFIKNFFNGKVTLYEAGIYEHYEGSLKVISEKETSEENGLEIIIPIKIEDVGVCWSDVFLVTAFWKEVEFTNVQSEELPDFINILYEDETIVVVKEHAALNHTWGNGKNFKAAVLNDGIIYPIPSKIFGKINSFGKNNISQNVTTFFKFASGELRPTISREGLEECKLNEDLICARAEMVTTLFSNKIVQFSQKAKETTFLKDMQKLWEEYKIFFRISNTKLKVPFSLGSIDLGLGRLHFIEENSPDNKVMFSALGKGKTILKQSHKQSWYDLTAAKPVYELKGVSLNSLGTAVKVDGNGGILLLISGHPANYLTKLRTFLNILDAKELNITKVSAEFESEIVGPISCHYLSCSSKEPKWTAKEYSSAQALKHPWVDRSVTKIPAFFLAELNKHLPNGHGLLLLVDEKICPKRERKDFSFYRNSVAWENALNYLLKALAQETSKKIHLIKQYQLVSASEIEKINLGLIDHPRIRSTTGWSEFSRIKDQINERFLKFLEQEDPESYILLNSVIKLKNKIDDLFKGNESLEKLYELVKEGTLPLSPSQAFLDGMVVINNLKATTGKVNGLDKIKKFFKKIYAKNI